MTRRTKPDSIVHFRWLGAVLATAAVTAHATVSLAQAVTPGELRTYATPQSIGVEWDVAGDPDHDATVAVRYRATGANAWSDAHPLFRVDFNGQNMLAGSVLFLEGSRDYEVELALTDPDGGSETRLTTLATLDVPTLPTGGRALHVVPGSGGGSGSEADPFQGIEAADAVALPGDVIWVHGGDYTGTQTHFDAPGTRGQYVAWVAAPGETPHIGDLRIRGDYIWIEGFDIVAPTNAVRHEGPSFGAVVKGNRISGCHYCIHLGAGAESWWISDNVIVGDQDPASGSLSGEGIELQHTPGHTIAYNSISRVADGVSYPDRNVDIFGNDIFETSDDGIEPDSGYANIRIWGNRISHAHNNGITFQPMSGAPWYIIRNQVIGSGESVLKLRDAVDRVLLAHNTFVGWTRVLQNSVGFIRNMFLRNNLWITMQGDYLWEDTGSTGVVDNFRTDIDNDGFSWPATTTSPLFKWENVRYADLSALQAATNIEQSARQVPLTCYESLDVPGPAPAVIPPQHVTLAAGCNAVDTGEVLPGINDAFQGAGPDLGAHERGAPLTHYGPRSGADGGGGAPNAGGAPGAGGAGGVGAGAGGAGGGGGAPNAGGSGATVSAGTSAGAAANAGGEGGSGANATAGGGITTTASGGGHTDAGDGARSPDGGTAKSGDDSGCGCRTTPHSETPLGIIGVLVAASWLRRRHPRETSDTPTAPV